MLQWLISESPGLRDTILKVSWRLVVQITWHSRVVTAWGLPAALRWTRGTLLWSEFTRVLRLPSWMLILFEFTLCHSEKMEHD
jgi:hypothetical protein